jgi:hypothetical protein
MGETTTRHNDAPVSARAVHLLPAGEVFTQGYPNTPVAVCGEPVTSGPDSDEEPRYCPECVSAALRRCAQRGVIS